MTITVEEVRRFEQMLDDYYDKECQKVFDYYRRIAMDNNALEKELAELLNRHSCEQASNTPDFVLANYLMNCLRAYNDAIHMRQNWHGAKPGEDKTVTVDLMKAHENG